MSIVKDIIDLVKDKAQKTYEEKTDVPNEKAAEVAEATGESIFDVLKEKVLGGKFKEVEEILSGSKKEDLEEKPVVKDVIEKVSERIQEKGIDKEVADQAAKEAAPEAIEKVSEKYASEAEEDAGFDLKDFIEMILTEDGREELLEKAKAFFSSFDDVVEDVIEVVTEKFSGMLGGLFGGDDDKKEAKK